MANKGNYKKAPHSAIASGKLALITEIQQFIHYIYINLLTKWG